MMQFAMDLMRGKFTGRAVGAPAMIAVVIVALAFMVATYFICHR